LRNKKKCPACENRDESTDGHTCYVWHRISKTTKNLLFVLDILCQLEKKNTDSNEYVWTAINNLEEIIAMKEVED